MAALMLGMVAQAWAEGTVNQTREKTGFWAVLFSPSAANSTATTAAMVCEDIGRSMSIFSWWHGVFVGTRPNATYYDGLEALNCLFQDSETGITSVQNAVYPVTRAVCPANSSPGSPCTCNVGYKPDPTMTSCIPMVQYTIALHNLGGEINTSASRAAHAQVMDGTTAKSGIAVTLTTSAPPEAGTAILSPTAGTTGADGKLNFTFTAPPVGGTHTVTATCDGGRCSNQATGTVVVTACPMKDLTSLAELSRLAGETTEQVDLTNKLERGVDGYSLLSQKTQAAEKCLAGKIATKLGPPSTSGYKVTSTVRTLAYQAHLREVWDKFVELQDEIRDNPSSQQSCQQLITTVEGEMGFRLNQNPANEDEDCAAPGRRHCLRHQPAGGENPRHTRNIAFDIPSLTVKAFERRLLQQQPPRTVQNEANACNLDWGGALFGDRVHFQMRLN